MKLSIKVILKKEGEIKNKKLKNKVNDILDIIYLIINCFKKPKTFKFNKIIILKYLQRFLLIL